MHLSPAPKRVLAVLIALSALTAALLAAEYLTAPGALRLDLANAGWTAAGLVAVVGVASGRARRAPGERRGWTALLVACLAWEAGQAFWNIYTVSSFPASPNPADGLWLAFGAMAAVAVQRLSVAPRPGGRVAVLEIGPLMVAVLALATALLWGDLEASKLPGPARVTVLAYPVLYVCAAVVLLQAVVSGALDVRRNPGVGALLCGLAIEAVAFASWAPELLQGSYLPGVHVLDVLWGLGMVAIGLGAHLAGPCVAAADVERIARRRGGVLPSLIFVLLSACQLVFVVSQSPTGADVALSVGVTLVGLTLIARTSVLRRKEETLLEALHARTADLVEDNILLGRESREDALTGVRNRLALREDFAALLAATSPAVRYCVVLCDLDCFKAYNDTLGHQAGDEVLREVAELLSRRTRAGTRVYRYGGEELLLLVTDADEATGRAVAERHRRGLVQAGMPHPGNAAAEVVTYSAGVAAVEDGETPDMVLRRADQALYRAKLQGRNRVVCSRDGAEPSPSRDDAWGSMRPDARVAVEAGDPSPGPG